MFSQPYEVTILNNCEDGGGKTTLAWFIMTGNSNFFKNEVNNQVIDQFQKRLVYKEVTAKK